jgi:hypothetical protein
MDDYSKEDLEMRAMALLGEHYSTFAAKEDGKKKVGIQIENKVVENDKPYGNLFD